jgi:hypothetical protein
MDTDATGPIFGRPIHGRAWAIQWKRGTLRDFKGRPAAVCFFARKDVLSAHGKRPTNRTYQGPIFGIGDAGSWLQSLQ